MAQLEISGVNKSYGKMQALFDVSLSIAKGEFVTLLGPSGSGKTTLLKILAGFEDVGSGRITLNGKDVTSYTPEQRNFGLVFQGYALFPHMSVFDNVAYPLRVRRMNKDIISQKVAAMLDLVQLGHLAKRRPSALSGGQQQRVALARALVFQPDLLLLDEPMSALDKKLRVDLQEQLREIHQNLGTTFINVTHDQDEAMHMSDRIAVMNNGRLEQVDSSYHLYRHPCSRFVAEFIGKSNIISGEVTLNAGHSHFSSGTWNFRLDREYPKGPADLLIRPEDIDFGISRDDCLRVDGRILSSTYSGDRALYTVDTTDLGVLSFYGHARDNLLSKGDHVTLGLPFAQCSILPHN